MSFLPLLLVLFVVGGAVAYLVTIYNGLIAVKNNVDKAWAVGLLAVSSLIFRRRDFL